MSWLVSEILRLRQPPLRMTERARAMREGQAAIHIPLQVQCGLGSLAILYRCLQARMLDFALDFPKELNAAAVLVWGATAEAVGRGRRLS